MPKYQDTAELLKVLIRRWSATHPEERMSERKLYKALYDLSRGNHSPFYTWECYESGENIISADLERFLFFAGAFGQLEWVQRGGDRLFTFHSARWNTYVQREIDIDAVYQEFEKSLSK